MKKILIIVALLLLPVLGFGAEIDTPLSVPSEAIVTGSCSNNPGPFITLTGEIAIGGIKGRLIFSNTAKQAPHLHTEDVVVEFVILEPGESIQFAKQPPLGGVGGNPFIWFQFVDDNGAALSKQFFLGRCQDMR